MIEEPQFIDTSDWKPFDEFPLDNDVSVVRFPFTGDLYITWWETVEEER